MQYKRQIDKHKKRFKILNNWEINYKSSKKYSSEVTRNTKIRKADIYPFEKNKEVPKDYIIHELLHVCFAELQKRKKYKQRREEEEQLIRDICKIIIDGL